MHMVGQNSAPIDSTGALFFFLYLKQHTGRQFVRAQWFRILSLAYGREDPADQPGGYLAFSWSDGMDAAFAKHKAIIFHSFPRF